MLNYVKSENYRIWHGREIYLVTAACSGLLILMNLALWIFSSATENFPYATTRFSLNMVTGSLSSLFYTGGLIAILLSADEHKYGTLKNAVSYGISRKNIFAGKCITSIPAAAASMVVILICHTASAYLLLENSGPEPLEKMLGGVAAALPSAVAMMVLATALLCIFKRESTVFMWWLAIESLIPILCFYIGLKVNILGKIAEWMPANFFKYEVTSNMKGYSCLWDTSAGLTKCIAAGLIGVIVFSLAGWLAFRKKEIS